MRSPCELGADDAQREGNGAGDDCAPQSSSSRSQIRARAEALPEDEHDRRHALIDESERLYAAALKLLTDHAVACV